MKEGIVKFFNEIKGFGFIKVSGTDEEIYVHQTGLASQIRQNDKVQFEVLSSPKGAVANNVKVIK